MDCIDEFESSSEESVGLGEEEVTEQPVFVYNNELKVVNLQANKKKRKLSASMPFDKIKELRGKLT